VPHPPAECIGLRGGGSSRLSSAPPYGNEPVSRAPASTRVRSVRRRPSRGRRRRRRLRRVAPDSRSRSPDGWARTSRARDRR